MKKIVLIIGNGFDLDLGLKTSYKDFVSSDYFKAIETGNVPNGMLFEGKDKERCILGNNKLALFIKEKAQENAGWVDTEECIKKYCLLNSFGDAANFTDFDKELFTIRHFLYKYLQHTIDNKKMRDNCNYKKTVAYTLLERVIESGVEYKIWNFNYTYSCRCVLDDIKGNPLNLTHIHSSVDECQEKYNTTIVLGVDYEKGIYNAFPSAVKLSNEHYSEYYNSFKDDVEESDEIVIMGHSIGSTDKQYFKNIVKTDRHKAITFITKNQTSLNDMLANMNKATDGEWGLKLKDGEIRNRSFVSEGYYEALNTINTRKKEELLDLLERIVKE